MVLWLWTFTLDECMVEIKRSHIPSPIANLGQSNITAHPYRRTTVYRGESPRYFLQRYPDTTIEKVLEQNGLGSWFDIPDRAILFY